MNNQILIVDSDEAFATILKEGIEMSGEYEATLVTTALKARDIAAQGHLAMAIIDMVLENEDSLELLHALRDRHPQLRLMVIPIDSPPAEVVSLGIQGTLSKPFFLPDIPSQIEAALSRPVGISFEEEGQVAAEVETLEKPDDIEPARIMETPAAEVLSALSSEPALPVPSDKMLAHLASESHRLTNQLRYLSRELNADAVLLTYGTELVAYAGHFGRADAERLAHVVSESWQASARVAAALGREHVRFEQSLHEGEDYLLYSVATGTEIVLSVALRSDRPLGIIRYNTKQTAQELEPLLLPR